MFWRSHRLASCLFLLVAMALTGPAAAGPKIGSVYSASDGTFAPDLKKNLEDLRIFDKVDSIDASFAAPNLMTLRQYDAVVVWSDGRQFGDRVTLGNVLSQYVDAGGGVVILNPYVMWTAGLAGDFVTKYNLIDLSSARSAFGLDIMKVEAAHPVLAGVNKINASGGRCIYQSNVNAAVLRNGGKIIANWSDGQGAVIVGAPNGRQRVDINLWAASNNVGSGCWDAKADGAKLIGNALLFVASPLRATPSAVDFGDVGVMTVSPPQTVEIKNSGMAPVVINSGAVEPPGEFTVTLNDGRSYPITLNAGQSFTFDVRLRPSGTGARSASYVLTPAMGMGGAPQTSVSLRGNGIGPRFASNPESVDFGGIPFRGPGMTASSPVTLQLRNSGGGQLRLKTVTLSDAVNFRLDLRGLMLPNILVGGAFQTVDVTFTPSMKGRFSGELRITYDLIGGAMDQTATVQLDGSSGDPQIELPGGNITLQPVRVGKTGPIEFITVTNSGLATLSITGLMLGGTNPGDFKLESAATMMNPILVPPNGGQSDIQVRFTPTVQGLRRATLTIASDDPMKPMASIVIDSRGTVAHFALDRMMITYPNPQQTGTCSPSEMVTVTNSGDDSLTITSVGFDGMNPGSFRQPITGSRQVPGGGGRLGIPVSFCPAAIGTQTANLVIATDLMAGHTAKIPLSAVGKGPRLTATPDGLQDFGPVYIKTASMPKTIVLKNEGDEDIVFGKNSLNPPTAPFTVSGVPAEMSTLKPGMTAMVTITARPMAAMVSEASLEIVVNDQVLLGLLRIPLSVTGTQANITVLPKQMMFPVTGVGVKSAEQTLSVLNGGVAPLTGLSLTVSGAHAQDFGYTGEVPASLDPSKSASFKVFFRPGGNGMRSGALVIRAVGLAADEQVRLEGTGKSLSVSCSPDYRDFGAVSIGSRSSQTVVCQNMDTTPVEIETSFDDFAEDWSVESESKTIPGSDGGDPGILQLRIVFSPMGEGARNSNLVIKAKESGIVIASVGLDANGTAMKMEMMKSGCSFGGGPGAPAGGALLSLALLGLLLRRRRR